MNLKQTLIEKKSAILKAWCDAALAAPADGPSEFPEKQNALLTEVSGCSLEQGIEGLFDALLQGVMPENTSRFLDGMVGMRAESDFTASQSVEFVIALKNAVGKELGREFLHDPQGREELAAWDVAVDDLVLFAFDRYVQHREAVLKAKAEEDKKKTLRLLRKAKLIPDDQEQE